MHKRTKIITTVGPSTRSKEGILNLYKKGMNVVRVNMSHASHADLDEVIDYVTKINKTADKSIGIMVDTQGPEIRTAVLISGPCVSTMIPIDLSAVLLILVT